MENHSARQKKRDGFWVGKELILTYLCLISRDMIDYMN